MSNTSDDIWFYIFAFLDTITLVHMRIVCKQWQHVIDSILHHRTIKLDCVTQLPFCNLVQPWIDLHLDCDIIPPTLYPRIKTCNVYDDTTTYTQFTHLKHLYINTTNNILPPLDTLHTLVVFNNSLTSLPSLQALTYLDVACNSLTNVDCLNTMQHLQYCNISYNYISTLNLSCPNLELLIISGNQMTSLSLNCSKLTHLVANLNELTSLPIIPSIQFIEVVENKITCIPDAIDSCRYLTHLNVYRNKLVRISTCINKCPLKVLNVSQNDITELYLNIPSLVELYLGGNQFINLSLYNMIDLQVLKLSYCFLYDVPPHFYTEMPNLIHANLDFNGIVSIDSAIKNWTRLKTLDLGFNCLNNVPDELIHLPLNYLDLTCNYLEKIPNELYSVPNLSLKGNSVELDGLEKLL